ncbi:MAG: Zn-dependent protease with chaperone function [Crocinitomix sp.]|jgi:Zn-dependent protease with chaperone function
MKSLYNFGPSGVPDTLTKSSANFKKKVALAIVGLLLFIVTYFGLMIWFGYTSYQMFAALQSSDNRFLSIVVAVVIGILSIFMLKSIFNFSKTKRGEMKFISSEQEPVLFDFIYKLADEAGARRPHKVIISQRVNASVFYDLNIFNLLFPSKKNLEIGLGLVNVVNLGEFKAILAHEFGHFAQRSMLLGRYVYVAHQIAERIVNKRDSLDGFLRGLSSVDIRIAWIGWILSILVWAVRSLVEVLFSIVVIAERALSREMEFQADLVAVSLTGSDDLINGLHKLGAADEAFNGTIQAIDEHLKELQKVPDLFSLQTFYLEKMRIVLGDPSFGATPKNFKAGIQSKIFETNGINPPEMWATHPDDEDREANAKRTYIPSLIDDRSTWLLFSNPTETRKASTVALYESIEKLPECELVSEEVALAKMDADSFDLTFLHPDYKGLFFSRSMMLYVSKPEEIYKTELSGDINSNYKQLYPDSLKRELESLKQLQLEKTHLKTAKNEVLTAERRAIFFRGNEIKKSEIKRVLEQVELEIIAIENRLHEHDKKCRSVNYRVAKSLGSKQQLLYEKLIAALHYAEHSNNKMGDLFGAFSNSLAIAGTGSSNDEQIRKLLQNANRLGGLLETLFEDSEKIVETGLLNKSFSQKSYAELFEKFQLGHADRQNINDWIQHLKGWLDMGLINIWKLRNAALERLLVYEKELEMAHSNNTKLDSLNTEISVPEKYKLLVRGEEQETEFKLSFWDRFLAGYGIVPMIAKFLVSAALISGVIFLSNYSNPINLYVYNGLNQTVKVTVGEETRMISPISYIQMEIKYDETYKIIANNQDEVLIESFEGTTSERGQDYIYNVANAAYMVEYEIIYGFQVGNSFGENPSEDNNMIAGERWFATNADYIFTEPPNEIYIKNGRTATREALTTYGGLGPYNWPITFENKNDNLMIQNHAIWDAPNSEYLLSWFQLSAVLDSTFAFVEKRKELYLFEVAAQRFLYDASDSVSKAKMSKVFNDKFMADTANADLFYLKTRCEYDEELKSIHFEEGYLRWSENPWLAFAAAYGYAEKEEWQLAYDAAHAAAEGSPMLLDYVGVDFERLRRVIDPDLSKTLYENFFTDCDQVAYLRALEKGDQETLTLNPDECLYYLSIGEQTQAKTIADRNDISKDYYYYYLATSEDASSVLVDQVLTWDQEKGISSATIWMALGFKAKSNLDYSELIKQLPILYGEQVSVENVGDFLRAVKTGGIGKAERILNNLNNFYYKGYFALMGTIILGESAPLKWQFYVNRVLFINEKPFLPFTFYSKGA